MRLANQYPAVPYANFIDAVGPSVNADFLNFTQGAFQDIWGGLVGRSASIIVDEFAQRSYPSGTFGSFEVLTFTNTTYAAEFPFGPSQHGIWHVFATATAPVMWSVQDAPSWVGQFDFTIAAGVAVDKRSELDTAANRGFIVGLRDFGVPSLCLFATGSDEANWILYLDTTPHDTGVPVVDGQFYELQIDRKDQTAYAYIDGALVVTAAYTPDLHQVRRCHELHSPTMTAGNGYHIDYHRTWYQR